MRDMRTITKFGICLLLVMSCEKDKKDLIAPSEVSDLHAVYNISTVKLIWIDPLDEDLAKVLITYEDNIIEVAKGIQTKEFNNLEPEVNYTFTIKTIDKTGNQSEGIQIQCKIDYRQKFIGQFDFFSYYWTVCMGEKSYCDTQLFIGSISIIENSDNLIQIRYREGKQTTICGEDSVFGAHIEPQINQIGVLSYPRVLKCSNQSYFDGKYSHIDSIYISIGSGGQAWQHGQFIKGTRIE